MNEIKFQKGDTYRPDEDVGGSKSMWTAGIHKGGHGNAIEVYGQTQAEAEALRDIVLKGLSSPPAAAEGVTEEREFVMVGEEMLFGNAAIRHLRDELAGVRDLV